MRTSPPLRSTAAAVIALTIASLTLPSLAHAKRFGGTKSAPASMSRTPATAPPAVSKSPATPTTPAAPATATAGLAAAAAPTAAAGPGLAGTLGAAVVGGAVGSMAGNALAGGLSPDKEAAQAKEAKVSAAEKEAQDLQRKADEAKAKADAARAAAK